MIGRLWTFLATKENREIIAWIFGGVVVVVSGGFTAFKYLDAREIKSPEIQRAESPQKVDQTDLLTLDGCISARPFYNAPEMVSQIDKVLTSGKYQFSWIGGGPDGTLAVSSILDVVQDGDTLIIKYDWHSGIMKIKPVVIPYMPSAKGVDGVLQGTWTQTNGSGCIELRYSKEDGELTGRWNRGPGTEPNSAFLHRSP